MKKVLQCIHHEKSIHKKVLSRTTLHVISFSELKPIHRIQVFYSISIYILLVLLLSNLI